MTADSSACPLIIRLFGPFEAEVHGAPLPHLRTRKGAWLLALLALQNGRPVARDWLAMTLWPESLHFRESLRQSLKDLRRALGPEAARLRAPTPRTLVLDLTGAEVDVLAFDAAVARGDPPSLEQAVALGLRGPLLDGCPESWAFEARQPREQAFLEALELLATAAWAGADPVAAERYLRRAVAADPLRESAHRELMRVLAAGGNQGAALQVYRELRRRLRRELHAEPDSETRALFRTLRDRENSPASGGSRSFPAAPAPHRSHAAPAARRPLPVPLTSFVGREAELAEGRRLLQRHRLLTLTGPGGSGKTRLAMELAAELNDDFADGVVLISLAPLTDPARVTPTLATALGLREDGGQPLIEQLHAVLQGRQMLLVLDNFEPVIGAAPLVAALLEAAPELRVLATSREGLRLRGERELTVPPLPLPEPHSRLSPDALSRSDAVALFIDRAAEARPGFALTQENAAAVAEICRRVDGLPLALELAAARLRYFSPQRLLARLEPRLALLTGGARDLPARQRTLRATIAWSYDLLDAAERALFRRLSVFAGGFTLDAAAAVCSDFASGISDFGSPSEPKTSEGRQPLPDPIQNPKSKIQNGAVLAGCASLVEKSLLQGRPTPHGEPRFAMLETIREYGLECLTAAGEAQAVRWRHAQCMLALAEEVRPKIQGPEEGAWLERLEQEHDNLRAALAWAAARNEERDGGLRGAGAAPWPRSGQGRGDHSAVRGRSPGACGSGLDPGRNEEDGAGPHLSSPIPHPSELGLRLAGALCEFWLDRGYWDEGRQWLEQALAAAPDTVPSVERARALAAAGGLASAQHDISAARERLEESIALYRLLGETRGLVEALTHRARVLWLREGNPAAARVLQEEAAAWARTLGDPRLLALALGELGWVTAIGGDPQTGRVVLEEGLAFARRVGDQGLMVLLLERLGEVSQRQGDRAKAREFLEESVKLARAAKKKVPLCNALIVLANVLSQQGDRERAKSVGEESLLLARELRIPLLIGRAIASLTAHDPFSAEALRMVEQAVGESGPEVVGYALPGLVAVAPSYEEALRMVEHAAAEYGPSVIRWALRLLARRAPSHEEALRRIEQAARDYGPEAAIHPLGALGHAARERGDYGWAATCYRRRLALRQELGDSFAIAESLEDCAGLAAQQQQWVRAATLLGAAKGICAAMGRTLPASPADEYVRAVHGARAALGEAAFAAAWAEGRAMSLDEAVAFALAEEACEECAGPG